MLDLINRYLKEHPELKDTLTKENASDSDVADSLRLLADIVESNTAGKPLPVNALKSKLVKGILNSTPDGLLIVNEKGHIIFANKQAEAMFGYANSALTEKPLNSLLPERFKTSHKSHLKHFFTQPTTRQMAATQSALYGLRKNGEEFPIDISLSYIKTEKGVLAISNIRDITERKRSEAITKRNQRMLEESQKIARLGSWELNLTSSELTWSDEVYRIFEIDKDTFKASYDAFLNIIHPDDREKVNKAYTDSVKNRLPYNIVHRLQFDGGRIKYVREIGKTFYNEEGEPIRSVGTVHDITEVRKTTIELNKRLNDMMQFNYIVSHNLRSPVASILGLAKLLQEPDTSASEKEDITDHILSAAQRLDETIKDINTILDTKSSFNEQKEQLSLKELTDRTLDSLHITTDKNTCKLENCTCHVETNIPGNSDKIFTIKSYFESILYNLLSNAIKYRSDDRDLHLKINAERNGNTLLLTISDNGIGMDLEKYGDDVFSLYKRFNYEKEGKGIGLYMTKVQVEMLNGHVQVVSFPEKGTTFVLTFEKMY